MQQPTSSTPTPQAISTREVDLNEVIDFTKQTWKDNGPHILKNMIPVLAPLAFFYYVLSAIPVIVSAFPVFGGLAGLTLQVILAPFVFGLILIIQAAIFGLYNPISRIALHGKSGIPPNQSFLSLARQNILGLILLSLITGFASSLGMCFLIIPGIIIAIIAQPTGYLVATRGLSMGDAVRQAIDVIKANPIPVLAYHGIAIVLGMALAIPSFILIFVLYFIVSYISQFIGELMFAAVYPALLLSFTPIFAFIFTTLYAKLIDANTPPALANDDSQSQQPASGW